MRRWTRSGNRERGPCPIILLVGTDPALSVGRKKVRLHPTDYAGRFALLKSCQPERKILRRRRRVRVIKQAKRDPPISDRAFGIGLQHVLENCLKLTIPEGMLVSHPAIEAPLCCFIARRLEMNTAEPLIQLVLGKRNLPAR